MQALITPIASIPVEPHVTIHPSSQMHLRNVDGNLCKWKVFVHTTLSHVERAVKLLFIVVSVGHSALLSSAVLPTMAPHLFTVICMNAYTLPSLLIVFAVCKTVSCILKCFAPKYDAYLEHHATQANASASPEIAIQYVRLMSEEKKTTWMATVAPAYDTCVIAHITRHLPTHPDIADQYATHLLNTTTKTDQQARITQTRQALSQDMQLAKATWDKNNPIEALSIALRIVNPELKISCIVRILEIGLQIVKTLQSSLIKSMKENKQSIIENSNKNLNWIKNYRKIGLEAIECLIDKEHWKALFNKSIDKSFRKVINKFCQASDNAEYLNQAELNCVKDLAGWGTEELASTWQEFIEAQEEALLEEEQAAAEAAKSNPSDNPTNPNKSSTLSIPSA